MAAGMSASDEAYAAAARAEVGAADSVSPPWSPGEYAAMVARVAERNEKLRAIVDAVWPLAVAAGRREAAEAIQRPKRRLFSQLIATAHRLDVPFANDPSTPWETFVKPAMNALDRAIRDLAEGTTADSGQTADTGGAS